VNAYFIDFYFLVCTVDSNHWQNKFLEQTCDKALHINRLVLGSWPQGGTVDGQLHWPHVQSQEAKNIWAQYLVPDVNTPSQHRHLNLLR